MWTTTTTVQLDEEALRRELQSRHGAVGRVLGGFASVATRNISDVFRERAGGVYWPPTSTIEETGDGPRLDIFMRATRPHVIVPRNARSLRFVARSGAIVFTQRVNHPGSRVPQHLVEIGVQRAGQQLPSLVSP